MRSVLGSLVCLVFAVSAHAQDGGVVGADVAVGGGALAVTEGFDDRYFGFANANVYFETGLGLHGEVAMANREESGGLFVAGASFNTPGWQIKGLAGSSTDVDGIFPDLYLRGEATYRSNPATGVVVTPGLSFRQFRNGADEIVSDASLTKYFSLGVGKALIGQLYGSIGRSDPGENISASVGAGLSYSAYKSYTFGVFGEFGKSAYDSVLGPGSIRNDFYSIRPSVAVFLSESVEVFGRAEYTDTDEFDLYGGSIGLKVYLSPTAGAPK